MQMHCPSATPRGRWRWGGSEIPGRRTDPTSAGRTPETPCKGEGEAKEGEVRIEKDGEEEEQTYLALGRLPAPHVVEGLDRRARGPYPTARADSNAVVIR